MTMSYWWLRPPPPKGAPAAGRPIVLVVGAYMTDQPTNVEEISAELNAATAHEVRQSWASVGGGAKPGVPTAVTFGTRVPKYVAVNAIIDRSDLAKVTYLLVCDDDIKLPPDFVDRFLGLQSALGFALAQPARSKTSTYDHAIVRQCPGAVARQTLFVESGPCFSVHRSVFDLILPFDVTSPMGWGYEYVWAQILAANGLRMGIVDMTPVEHTLRPTAANYDWSSAYEAQMRLLATRAHLGAADCHRVLQIFWEPGPRGGWRGAPPDRAGEGLRHAAGNIQHHRPPPRRRPRQGLSP
jgi:hypothetical protein